MKRRADKKKIITVTLIGALLIGMFAFVLHLIEKNGLIDEQFGDIGGWGKDSDEEETTEIDIGGK